MLSLFIYSSATVFVIVGGQPTTEDDSDKVDPLTKLEEKLATLEAKNNMLEASVAELRAEQSTKRSNNSKSQCLC